MFALKDEDKEGYKAHEDLNGWLIFRKKEVRGGFCTICSFLYFLKLGFYFPCQERTKRQTKGAAIESLFSAVTKWAHFGWQSLIKIRRATFGPISWMIYGGVSKHFIKSNIFIILPWPFPHHTFLTVPAHPPVLWEDVEFVNIFYKQIVAANLFLLHFLSAAPPFSCSTATFVTNAVFLSSALQTLLLPGWCRWRRWHVLITMQVLKHYSCRNCIGADT